MVLLSHGVSEGPFQTKNSADLVGVTSRVWALSRIAGSVGGPEKLHYTMGWCQKKSRLPVRKTSLSKVAIDSVLVVAVQTTLDLRPAPAPAHDTEAMDDIEYRRAFVLQGFVLQGPLFNLKYPDEKKSNHRPIPPLKS